MVVLSGWTTGFGGEECGQVEVDGKGAESEGKQERRRVGCVDAKQTLRFNE